MKLDAGLAVSARFVLVMPASLVRVLGHTNKSMSPPFLVSSTREPNNHTDVPWPNAAVAAWRMVSIWAGVRRMVLSGLEMPNYGEIVFKRNCTCSWYVRSLTRLSMIDMSTFR